VRFPLMISALSLCAILVAAPASAQLEGQDAATYQKCLDLARANPSEGFETASSWRDHGGGLPAEHCVAIALVGLKDYAEAARRLEKIANEMTLRESTGLRADVLSQAAEAWLEGGSPDGAVAALNAAIELAPKNPDYFVSRAVAYAQRKNYKGAIQDLNRALAIGGPRGDALAYRASAYRHLGDLKQARADADKAVQMDPKLPDAWLERANIKRLTGDDAGARRDWLTVLDLAPDSAAADAARENLETLDVHVEGPPTGKH
jgi:tetratricopeptide (TPR) repeat protein